jgi:hypothetical protein
MKKIYLFLIVGLLLVGTIAIGTITVNELYKNTAPSSCKEFVYRNSFIWLPEKVSEIFIEDRIILHFSMLNGEDITVNGIVKKGRISELQCEPFAHHDFEVWMGDLNALELATSEKPITTFVKLWRRGQIKLEANGEDNQKKLEYADQLVGKDNEPVPEWIRNIFSKYLK